MMVFVVCGTKKAYVGETVGSKLMYLSREARSRDGFVS